MTHKHIEHIFEMSMSPITPNCTDALLQNQGKLFKKRTYGTFDVPYFGRFQYDQDGLTVERCDSYFVLIMQFKSIKVQVISPTTKHVKFNGRLCKHIIFSQLSSRCNLTQTVMQKVKLQSKYFEMFNKIGNVQSRFYLNVSQDNRLQCPVCGMCISSIDYFNDHFQNTVPKYEWHRRYIYNSVIKWTKRIPNEEYRKQIFGHESREEIESIYNNCTPLRVPHFNMLKSFTDELQLAKSDFQMLFVQSGTKTMPSKLQ